MFCGFGAVILLVLVINANTISFRKKFHTDMRADVLRLELEAQTGREHLVQIQNSLTASEKEITETSGKSDEMMARMEKIRE